MNYVLLSELHDSELLFIEKFHNDPTIISKEDFLSSYDYLEDIRNVSLAEPEIMSFDLKNIIDQIGEDAYEDWNEQVWDSIKDAPETKAFLELIKNTFSSHKVYYSGRNVIIDLEEK